MADYSNETNQYWKNPSRNNVPGRIFGGLIVVIIGVVLLAKQMGVELPYWLFSWQLLLIAIGLYVGFRHSFRGPAWVVLVLVGFIFLLDKVNPALEVEDYIIPIIIIAIGLVIIFRPQKKNINVMQQFEDRNTSDQPHAGEDVIDSVVVFGGVKKNIISKTFKGGELTTIFGGTELNLTQADVEGKIVIDVTQIFGGSKLIVPPHWTVQSDELVCILGGLDDKRPIQSSVTLESNKVLVLKGTCILGGIDIRSY